MQKLKKVLPFVILLGILVSAGCEILDKSEQIHENKKKEAYSSQDDGLN